MLLIRGCAYESIGVRSIYGDDYRLAHTYASEAVPVLVQGESRTVIGTPLVWMRRRDLQYQSDLACRSESFSLRVFNHNAEHLSAIIHAAPLVTPLLVISMESKFLGRSCVRL